MKLTAVIGTVLATAGIALAVAPIASADEDSYVADINQGIGANEIVPGTWVSLGYGACNTGSLDAGTQYIYNNTDGTVDLGEAQFAAEAAFMFLC